MLYIEITCVICGKLRGKAMTGGRVPKYCGPVCKRKAEKSVRAAKRAHLNSPNPYVVVADPTGEFPEGAEFSVLGWETTRKYGHWPKGMVFSHESEMVTV